MPRELRGRCGILLERRRDRELGLGYPIARLGLLGGLGGHMGTNMVSVLLFLLEMICIETRFANVMRDMADIGK